eukprot:scaffold108127_cov28-Tisochrysis_lutea.AAC.1
MSSEGSAWAMQDVSLLWWLALARSAQWATAQEREREARKRGPNRGCDLVRGTPRERQGQRSWSVAKGESR